MARILALVATVLMLATPAAGAATDTYVRVKVDTANIREGPGTGYDRLWQVSENFPLRIVDRKGRWLKTEDVLGDHGWIYAPLTDDKPAVAVEVEVANVRSGPGTRYPVEFAAELGEAFRVLGEKGSWVRVEHAEQGVGWIHRNLLWGDVD